MISIIIAAILILASPVYAEEPLDTPPIQTAAVSDPSYDRTKGLFLLSKDGWVLPNQHIETQWLVYDLCRQYNFPVRYMFGLILAESEFVTHCTSSANCKGLCQISSYWLRADIPRLEPSPQTRDLQNAYDNVITSIEIQLYGAALYNYDLNTEEGYWKNLVFYNSGKNPNKYSHYKYADKAIRYSKEIQPLQGDY